MTFEQWGAFYQAVMADRFERHAADVAVVHAANPRRTRQQFLTLAQETLRTGRRPLAADPERLKAVMRGIHGVGIETVERKAEVP